MSANQNDQPQTLQSSPSLDGLRDLVAAGRSSDDPQRLHDAMLDAVGHLITHLELQHREIEDIRRGLEHQQGTVTPIEEGETSAPPPGGALRAFAASSNGDRWFLGRDAANGAAHVVHKANEPSGGAVTRIELGLFLNRGHALPEQIDLLRLIGSLAE